MPRTVRTNSGSLMRSYNNLYEVIGELLHGCYKAGASTVSVSLRQLRDDTYVIDIRDNGRGCPDPATLFTNDDTDGSSVDRSPVGSGFFNILHPDLFDLVEVRSGDWCLSIPVDSWRNSELVVGTVSSPSATSGFCVELRPTGGFVDNEDFITYVTRARSTYPFRFMLNGEEISPSAPSEVLVTIGTPVGEVMLLQGEPWNGFQSYLVRDHQFTRDSLFLSRLMSARNRPIDSIVKSLAWVVDPACGVTFDPERSLVNSPSLDAAATTIVEYTRDALLHHIESCQPGWLDSLSAVLYDEPEWEHPWEADGLSRLVSGNRSTILSYLGYHKQLVDDLSHLDLSDDGDGLDVSLGSLEVFVRLEPGSAGTDIDSALLTTLKEAGISLDTPGVLNGLLADSDLEIVLHQPIRAPASPGRYGSPRYVLAADSIRWNGIALPFFLGEYTSDDGNFYTGLVLQGSPETVATRLMNLEGRLLNWLFYKEECQSDFYDSGSEGVLWDHFKAAVARGFCADYGLTAQLESVEHLSAIREFAVAAKLTWEAMRSFVPGGTYGLRPCLLPQYQPLWEKAYKAIETVKAAAEAHRDEMVGVLSHTS